MKKSKVTLLLFISLFAYFLFTWFISVLPLETFNKLITDAPGYLNQNLLTIFPNDLVVTVAKGEISLNRPSPYCFILDQKSNSGIIFDQNASSDYSAFTSESSYSELCKPLALLGKSFIMYPDNQSFKVDQLPSDLNFTLNKTDIEKFVADSLPKLINTSRILYYIVPFIFTIFTFFFILLSNYWYAFVVSFASKTFKINQNAQTGDYFDQTLILFVLFIVLDQIITPIINTTFSLNLSFGFPLRNTILITVYSLYRQTKIKTP
jgi:hypothetical protein